MSSYLMHNIPVMNPSEKNMVYHPCMSAGRPATKQPPLFGQKLAKLRKQHGWTQPDLAERLGVSVKTVTYYEREAENPTTKTIQRIAQVFNLTSGELMAGVDRSPLHRKSGPPSRLETIFVRVSELPRTKQKLVADMLEGFLERAS